MNKEKKIKAAIANLKNRRRIYMERNIRHPGLWEQEILDCAIMIDQLEKEGSLSRYFRGLTG